MKSSLSFPDMAHVCVCVCVFARHLQRPNNLPINNLPVAANLVIISALASAS